MLLGKLLQFLMTTKGTKDFYKGHKVGLCGTLCCTWCSLWLLFFVVHRFTLKRLILVSRRFTQIIARIFADYFATKALRHEETQREFLSESSCLRDFVAIIFLLPRTRNIFVSCSTRLDSKISQASI